MVAPSFEATCSPIAVRQRGLITHEQLVAVGHPGSVISRRLRDGRLQQRHRGVYALPGSEPTYEQALLAAVLATGPGSVVSHRAACHLWDIDAPGVYGVSDQPPVEITVPTRRSPRPRGVVVHRSLDLIDEQTTRRRGIAVTNPLRLLVDLGAVVPAFLVERALDQLLIKRVVTVDGVRALLGRLRKQGRRGCGVLAEVLASRGLGDAIPDGMLEPIFANLCRDHGLDQPVFQHELSIAGRRRRIDFAYVHLLIAIEVDGWETHGIQAAFGSDRATSNELQARGWIVLRFTWDDVIHRPGWVALVVRRAIGQRRLEPLR